MTLKSGWSPCLGMQGTECKQDIGTFDAIEYDWRSVVSVGVPVPKLYLGAVGLRIRAALHWLFNR